MQFKQVDMDMELEDGSEDKDEDDEVDSDIEDQEKTNDEEVEDSKDSENEEESTEGEDGAVEVWNKEMGELFVGDREEELEKK